MRMIQRNEQAAGELFTLLGLLQRQYSQLVFHDLAVWMEFKAL
jgi:hypothetical protein